MARGCYGRSKKKLKAKNWKETAKDRTWRDLAEKAKTHKGLQCQIMMMIRTFWFYSHIEAWS